MRLLRLLISFISTRLSSTYRKHARNAPYCLSLRIRDVNLDFLSAKENEQKDGEEHVYRINRRFNNTTYRCGHR